MSQQPKLKIPTEKEYVVRVPSKSRKNYHMMRFHTANGIDFKAWGGAKMERENNLKEYKIATEDMPRYGAGSEFGREQRDEARRKKHGIRVKKYKADDQPWLLSLKDRISAPPPGKSSAPNKKFKGIREGGVSDNVSWYVFLQAKDGAFEAYPVEEWYNFQPINRYKSLNAEEAEVEFEKRDKIRNYFSVMYQKKLRNEDDDKDADGADEGKKKGSTISKALMLSEMDDWMSDRDSDDSGSDDGVEKKVTKSKAKKPVGKKKKSGHRGVKKKRKEDGEDGTDCEEESDDYNDGAEHEYMSEDSSDSEQENDEKVTKDLKGVDEDQGLKKLLNSDEEDEDDENKNEEDKSGDEEEKKNKKSDTSPELSDSSDEEKMKTKGKESKKAAGTSERASESLKRKIVNSEGSLPGAKKARCESPNSKPSAELTGESSMFEEQIRRYLLRKPMNTTEILQKLKSKKTGHTSEQLVQIIAIMLKKINPQKQRVQGKMYLSLKEK